MQNLSQRWSWKDNSNHLVNGLNNQNLGHDKSTGQLGLYSQETDSVKLAFAQSRLMLMSLLLTLSSLFSVLDVDSV